MKKGARQEFRDYAMGLICRIAIALGLCLSMSLFYAVFTPLTLHFSYLLFSLFVPESALAGMKIVTVKDSFEFIPACTAASAYLLLALLILVTKGIKPIDRASMFVYGSLAVLAFNLLRIEALFVFYFKFNRAYPAVHMFFWKFMSTAFVAAVWFALTRLYRVREIPVYSDFRHLMSSIKWQ